MMAEGPYQRAEGQSPSSPGSAQQVGGPVQGGMRARTTHLHSQPPDCDK